ncbi:GNAT family protein [uncultured Brachyspira sp.]|uniref:GNAT family N-acetyltransferase n=1 Tax=uncultured Brachyspira sp. TaxID=221953 RepID=UPI00321FB06B
MIIREVHITDAKNVVDFIKEVSDESDFLICASDERELSVEKESEFIQTIEKSVLEKMFLCEIDEKIVGICSIRGVNKKRVKHRVSLGISVLKEYWGRGIASKLLEYTINYCKANDLKKIELNVRADNNRVISLYKKFGFEIEGEIRNFFYLNGVYYNCYLFGLLL